MGTLNGGKTSVREDCTFFPRAHGIYYRIQSVSVTKQGVIKKLKGLQHSNNLLPMCMW